MPNKILIVDDEEDTVRLAQKLLISQGFSVVTAYNGEEALNRLYNSKEKDPDLILLDLKMPKKDGFEVCQKIKQDPEKKHILILVFTAKTFDKDRNLAYELGADEYITKPFSGENLVNIIKEMLEKRKIS
ncbi:MAG: response regulator [Candidatus Lokiarchaeota archaeon]|nr:response regulator [Candidatus Lokiarchaeota archaeon]